MSVFVSSRRRPLGRCALLALFWSLALPAAPALAGPGGGNRLSPEQAARIFPERRAIALRDLRARISLLQRGERCLTGAADGDGLRRCLREERAAMMRQRQQSVAAMRQLYERNGLPVPEWTNRRRPGAEGSEGSGSP